MQKQELHNGVDIAVPQNTFALAVRSGVVTYVGTSQTYGNLIKYKTDDGFTIMYAHLNKALVKVGDSIKQGDKIAKTGNTGLSTGAHLHYSVWKGSMLIDPMQFVSLKHTKDVELEYAARGASINEKN